MKSVARLRLAGFTVAATHSDVAVGCTEVVSAKPFFYFNPKVASTPEEVFDNLTTAPEVSPKVFRLVIAGDLTQEKELPFVILTTEAKQVLETQYRQCEEANGEVARLKHELAEAERRVLLARGDFGGVLRDLLTN